MNQKIRVGSEIRYKIEQIKFDKGGEYVRFIDLSFRRPSVHLTKAI